MLFFVIRLHLAPQLLRRRFQRNRKAEHPRERLPVGARLLSVLVAEVKGIIYSCACKNFDNLSYSLLRQGDQLKQQSESKSSIGGALLLLSLVAGSLVFSVGINIYLLVA